MKRVIIIAVAGWTLAAALWQQGAGAAQQQLQQLRDPFAPAVAPARALAAAAAAAAAAPAAPEAPPWKPELRAIIYDRAHSLANVSGVVLAVGESVHGYRVVRINERSVVMDKGGAAVKLTLDNRDISQ